jgi:hypothetical protein
MTLNLRDDVFTMPLPGSDLVFTRYLYVKDEVRVALLVALLNKSDSALFWAYELYHSGFKHELLKLLWKIYYDFYAVCNPSYEEMLIELHNDCILHDKAENISIIVQDLLIRKFNTDIFGLRNCCEQFEPDLEEGFELDDWVNEQNYRSIAQWVYNVNKKYECDELYTMIVKQDNKGFKELVSILDGIVNPKVLLITKIMQMFSKGKHKDCNLYMYVEPEDVDEYKNIESIVGRRVLEKASVYNIDEFTHLSLFKLTRFKYDLTTGYRTNWEYHASFSPLWSQRIRNYGGVVDFVKRKVIFKEEPDDEQMQRFYRKYGYEPDEQSTDVQYKNIQPIDQKYDWAWFISTYRNSGLFELYNEEIDEFDNECLMY